MHPTRIFKHPDELAKAWGEYKESIKQQAAEWMKVQFVGKDGDRVEEPTKVPYTFEGFKRFCREKYGCVNDYFLNSGGYYEDFTTICSHIKDEIRENQIVGGMLGFFNPSITQRLNGLSEKQQVETKVVDKFDFDN
jgi:hypothetical protein